jgi:GH24 family phage-related lysozyme (muramidase)
MLLPGASGLPGKETPGIMTPSEKLIGFLANYEGDQGRYRPKPYKVAGRGNWTIGFGHEIKPGEDFSNGISEEEAWKLLRKDVKEHADAIYQWAAANKVKLTQQQFDALVSLRFNLGSLDGAPKLRSLIISGNATPEQIRKEFEDIIRDEVGRQEGLWQRRRDEADMFFNNDYRRKELPPPKHLFPNF